MPGKVFFTENLFLKNLFLPAARAFPPDVRAGFRGGASRRGRDGTSRVAHGTAGTRAGALRGFAIARGVASSAFDVAQRVARTLGGVTGELHARDHLAGLLTGNSIRVGYR